MARKPAAPTQNAELLVAMKQAILDILNSPHAKLAEKVKAIDAASKILAVEAKINAKVDLHGSFFADKH